MVRNLIGLFNKEVRAVHHAAYILAASALVSQLLALFRDRVFASTFGVGKELDLYYAAFRIPDMLFIAVSALISVSVLVPMLVEAQKRGEKDQEELIKTIFTAFFWMVLILALAAFFVAPLILPLLFPAYGDMMPELVAMTRLLLLSPILLGISNIFSSIIQTSQRFIITALSPILYNLGIICGAVFLAGRHGIIGAVWGVAIGAFLHAAIQLPYLIKQKKVPGLSRENPFVILRKSASVIRASLPRTLSLSISELVEFTFVIVAGYLVVGSITVFNLAWNLQSVSLSLIGMSFSVALFPTLTRLFSEQNNDVFREKFIFTLRQVIFFGLLASALCIVLRAQIVRTALGAGAFDWNATRLTAAAFALFTTSLVLQSLSLVMTRTWYARGSTKIPLLSNLLGGFTSFAVLGILMILWNKVPAIENFLEHLLRVEGEYGSDVLMLPIAFSIGAAVTACSLLLSLRKVMKGYLRSLVRPVCEHLLGAFVAGAVAYTVLQLFADSVDTTRVLGVFLHGAVAGVTGIVGAFAILLAIGNLEARHVLDGITRKKPAVVISENEPV
ncbi:MAG TPA: lipid II flippase MurJ [Candidatus Paceibacterota bacterium]|nr:lipid II flippase MurJ [Candidatus Paceibacterota bacterium]